MKAEHLTAAVREHVAQGNEGAAADAAHRAWLEGVPVDKIKIALGEIAKGRSCSCGSDVHWAVCPVNTGLADSFCG